MDTCDICFDLIDNDLINNCSHHFHKLCLETGNLYRCPICNFYLWSNAIWRAHYDFLNRDFSNSGSESIYCHICGKTISDQEEWGTYNGNNVCKHCLIHSFYKLFKPSEPDSLRKCSICHKNNSYCQIDIATSIYFCEDCYQNRDVNINIIPVNGYVGAVENFGLVNLSRPNGIKIPELLKDKISEELNIKYVELIPETKFCELSGSLLEWTFFTEVYVIDELEVAMMVNCSDDFNSVGIYINGGYFNLFDSLIEYIDIQKGSDADTIKYILSKNKHLSDVARYKL